MQALTVVFGDAFQLLFQREWKQWPNGSAEANLCLFHVDRFRAYWMGHEHEPSDNRLYLRELS